MKNKTERVLDTISTKRNATEADILKYAKGYLKNTGWFVVRIQQGIGCHPGVSDLIAIKNGVTVWLEIKSPKWKPRPQNSASKTQKDQDKFRENILNHGGLYLIVNAIEQLEDIGGMI